MKNKILFISLAVVLALSVGLIGCGGEEVPEIPEIPEIPEYNLAISSTEGGEVTTPGEGTFTYDKGKRLTLEAIPDDGNRFVNWIGDVDTIADVEDATTAIIINGDYSITANFEEDEVVTFLDLNFEAAVRQAIVKPEGPIYTQDMESLIFLYAHQSGISDLTGLEYATRLIHLYLWDNLISDVSPLASLTQLKLLSLGNNRVSDISPLANLTSLINLDIRDNQIRDISPLVDNPGLSYGDKVDLRYNPLTFTSTNTYIPQLQGRGVIVRY